MEDLKEKILLSENTKSVWRGNPNSEEWRNANKMNILLFGMPLNRTPKCQCIEDLFFILKMPNINTKIQHKMEQKFKLKKGKVISSFAFHFTVTNDSTDEQFIEALRLQPTLIVHFDSYPEDWAKICGVVNEVKTNDVIEEVKDEFISPVKQKRTRTRKR